MTKEIVIVIMMLMTLMLSRVKKKRLHANTDGMSRDKEDGRDHHRKKDRRQEERRHDLLFGDEERDGTGVWL